MKTTSLSVRVDDDDAAFLAGLHVGDARTPSEKLRALLRSERRRQEGARNALEATDMVRDLLQASKRRMRELELDTGARSDFLKKVYDRLPEIAGLALAGPIDEECDNSRSLEKFERLVINEVFSFVHEILELGLSPRNRVLDSETIESRLSAILEFIELINISKQRKEGRI